MDGDLAALIVAMTLIVLTFGTISGALNRKHKLKTLEIEARIAEANAAKGQPMADDVEERLRVLERIVTDPSTDLSKQIENLRTEKEEAN